MAALLDITDESFEREVLQASGTTVVDFWAPWCGPCVALTPHLERLAETLPAQARIVKLDVDSQPETARRLHVRGLPVLVAFRGGQEIARLREVKNPRQIQRWLGELAGASEQVRPSARL